MKLSNLLEELNETLVFKNFIEKNPDLFLTAGFFILDLESNNNKYQLDFFLPKQNKIAVIEYPFNQIKIEEEEITDAKKLEQNIKIDIENLREKIEEIKEQQNNNQKTNKIIAVLKDNLWNLTCLSLDLSILRIKINSLTGELEGFEKSSLMDFARFKS